MFNTKTPLIPKDFRRRFKALPPQAKRLLAITVFCLSFGLGGTQMTLASFANKASAPTYGTITMTAYKESKAPGNELEGVAITVSAGCVVPNTANTTGTTNGRGDQKFVCKADKNGTNYTFVNATKDGYAIAAGAPHPAGDSFTVIKDQDKNEYSIIMHNTTAPAQGGGAAAPESGGQGTITMTAYKESKAPGNELEGVLITTSNGGNGPVCSPVSGTTNGRGDQKFTCPADKNGTGYAFVGATKAGYELSADTPHKPGTDSGKFTIEKGVDKNEYSIIMHSTAPTYGSITMTAYKESKAPGNELKDVDITVGPGCIVYGTASQTTGSTDKDGRQKFACQATAAGTPYTVVNVTKNGYIVKPDSPHGIGSSFTVVKDVDKDEYSIVMHDTTPAPEPKGSGTITITAYKDAKKPGNELKDVAITVSDGCVVNGTSDKRTGTTNGQGDQKFSCKADKNGTAYNLVDVSRDGYVLSADTPHGPGSPFTVVKDQDKADYSVILNKVSSPAAAATSPANDASQKAPDNKPDNHPDAEKRGSVQVTTYLFNPNTGTRSRLAGVQLHIQSVGHNVQDANDSCSDYNQTTGSSGESDGQVHFKNCWTGSGADNAKNYQLSFASLPPGYAFKSFSAGAGGRFISGKTTTDEGLTEQFNVRKDQETKLEIVVVRVGAGDQPKTVVQVINANGIHYNPANNSEQAKKDAAALNAITRDGKRSPRQALEDEIEDDYQDEEDADTPPAVINVPTDFKAVQDESGSVLLSWGTPAATNTEGEITYEVERSVKGSTEDPMPVGDDVISSNSTVDVDIDFPQTYVYAVRAIDEGDGSSDQAFVELAVTQPTPNVAAGVDGDSSGSTEVKDDDGSTGASIPTDASKAPLACAVNDNSSDGSDVADAVTSAPVEVDQLICRDSDGEVVDEFDDDITFSLSVEDEGDDIDDASADSDDEDLDDYDVYGYNGTDWEEVDEEGASQDTGDADTANTQNPKSSLHYANFKKVKKGNKLVYVVKTSKPFPMMLVKHQQQTSVSPIVPATSALMLIGAGYCTRQMIRRRYLAAFYNYGPDELLAGAYFSEAPVLEQPKANVGARPIQPHQTVFPQIDHSQQPVDPNMVTPEHQVSYVVQPQAPPPEPRKDNKL